MNCFCMVWDHTNHKNKLAECDIYYDVQYVKKNCIFRLESSINKAFEKVRMKFGHFFTSFSFFRYHPFIPHQYEVNDTTCYCFVTIYNNTTCMSHSKLLKLMYNSCCPHELQGHTYHIKEQSRKYIYTVINSWWHE